MPLDTEPAADEIQRLRRSINDLTSVLALPAMWTGNEPPRVATTLLDALVRILRLDFAYLRTIGSAEAPPQEWIRSGGVAHATVQPNQVGLILAAHIDTNPRGTSFRVDSPFSSGTLSSVAFDLGYEGTTVGVCVTGSDRLDFPTESERLLLQVAINQAAIALQEARRVSEQRHIANDLERRVVERTAELSAVNEAIKNEIAEHSRAERALSETEDYLKRMADSVPEVIWVTDLEPCERVVYTSPSFERVWGLRVEELYQNPRLWTDTIHPDDRARVASIFSAWIGGADVSYQDVEFRIVQPNGDIRWIHERGVLTLNEQGRPIRVSGISTDITDRKRAQDDLQQAFAEIERLKEQLQRENIALRQEIEQTSMFEEIVGVSPALRTVLAEVEKVAPTDSTVIIFGETGTGKELVARAIHKRSSRSSHAFVSVNCAAIPASLIASELFGHEKGAFTGALQRRQGRFELAERGTIFLDEVGELPSETQIALLRVLQEREFERVGGTRAIRSDVRVIAATNRDLAAAVDEKSFRPDLYYRLNVFPIEIPSLRERRADIPLLVEYFTHRFANRTGKRIHGISRNTLALLESYDWPGNIRELQNIIERAVIVCESETLSIGERWLSARSKPVYAPATPKRSTLAGQTKEAIEAALAESKGRVAGPFGAAARLGIPSTTLEAKIKALKIDKRLFKSA
jgi:PAS domain S-box-containing protein